MVRPALAPGRQLGLLWGAVAVGLLALSPAAPQLTQGLPACPLKSLSGLPCAACGSTRAALALVRGEVKEALVVNPLATVAWLGLVVVGLVAGVAALVGRPLSEPRWVLPTTARLGLLGILVANWLYLIWAGT